jgi:haloalkane dehalogenase
MLASKYVDLADPAMRLHYNEAGDGEPVVMLHGWPTSAYLWRNVIPHLAATHRAIALDLPGFGRSDKPASASYSFRFFERALDGAFDALGLERLHLVVHDLGGPVGVYWALRHPERVASLTLLNTLVYPELSWAVKAFGASTLIPGLRRYMTSRHGLALAMRIGVQNRTNLTAEVLANYQAPFSTWPARKILLRVGTSLSPKGLREIAERLPSWDKPMLLAYGENDRILPDVADTMARVHRDVPHAEVRAIPGCGHFLQEDEPAEVASILSAFLHGAAN